VEVCLGVANSRDDQAERQCPYKGSSFHFFSYDNNLGVMERANSMSGAAALQWHAGF
jgi:hypothetical protein